MCKHLDLRIVGKLVYITKNNAKKACTILGTNSTKNKLVLKKKEYSYNEKEGSKYIKILNKI